ncbi:probable WRKY transcription factor 54 [Benincasa hispida]|uniref:WRKY transcription factor 34 n=1 Tax=Benincasa hispida var. chieh-qua TaxID=1208597 RepID=A0A120MFL1_BENHI|nr:probable WRKY transcription factor 54 [Benincasa hispida]AMH38846.1 WRKY transcription factor 34 [Benincasa hispida var. chieh-qua]
MEAADFSHGGLPAEVRRKVTEKLLAGRDSAARLQILLRSAAATDDNQQALATKILSSITEAISILESAGDESSYPDHSLCSDLDSGDSRRSTAVKNNLGRTNKRRRLTNTRVITRATAEDEYAWRKYGQKVILNATYPRSYFRCTHKYDQSCRATKQVQRMEGTDSEIMYKITYISDHTCGPASPIVSASAVVTDSNSYNLISFSNSPNDKLTEVTSHNFIWPSDDDAVKMRETTTTSGSTDDEINMWLELKDFGSLHAAAAATMTMTNQYYFSTGDDDVGSLMFWEDCLQ